MHWVASERLNRALMVIIQILRPAKMARRAGNDPATFGFGDRCSAD